jgi:glycerol transport system ATP-binding protein
MRVMAGLDKPSAGRVVADGRDVTGISVRHRNLAMVYQQFINYPSFTVYDNIASPLRIKRVPDAQIRTRVMDMADRLHITPYLQRSPAELSGGQQQRTALARALIKESELLLLDEPLVNLDYKLREELRKELTELFSDGKTTVVYATTEPLEALQLGGHTVVLHEGRLLQQGDTLAVFNAPNSIQTARTFSDPPINLMPATLDTDGRAQLGAGLAIPPECRTTPMRGPAQGRDPRTARAQLAAVRAIQRRLPDRSGSRTGRNRRLRNLRPLASRPPCVGGAIAGRARSRVGYGVQCVLPA